MKPAWMPVDQPLASGAYPPFNSGLPAVPEPGIDPSRVVGIVGPQRVHFELEDFYTRHVDLEVLGQACSGPLGVFCRDRTLPEDFVVTRR
jgi:hypothetical protein